MVQGFPAVYVRREGKIVGVPMEKVRGIGRIPVSLDEAYAKRRDDLVHTSLAEPETEVKSESESKAEDEQERDVDHTHSDIVTATRAEATITGRQNA